MNQELSKQLDAVENGCGFASVPDRAFLRVTGADSTRWLNGMVTNSVAVLAPGEGAYSFLLNAQGRIQGDCVVYRGLESAPASFLLSSTDAQLQVLQPWLDRYIIMDDVELTRAFEAETTLVLLGGDLREVLQAVALPMPDPLRVVRADTPDGPLLLFTPAQPRASTDRPRLELRGASAILSNIRTSLLQRGVVELSPEALEAVRIADGVPLFGTDIRDRDLPQETGQAHALHFNKGCYLGQEIVERIRSRGQVHRVFTRFELTGTLPGSLPAPLQVQSGETVKAAGELTSAAWWPTRGGSPRTLALGYIRREFHPAQTTLTYPGGTALVLDLF